VHHLPRARDQHVQSTPTAGLPKWPKSAVRRPPVGGSLPADSEPGFALDAILDQVSRQYIQLALTRTGQKSGKRRKLLGLNSHQVLTARMPRLGLATDK
jgi:DNA-binding NtrC family response regulator